MRLAISAIIVALFFSLFLFLNTASNAAICPPLGRWMQSHPTIAGAVLLSEKETTLPWPLWKAEDRSALSNAYALACSGSTFKIPEPIPNIKKLKDGEAAKTVFSLTQGKQFFFASVALSLSLESQKKLGWSLDGYSADELRVLFDSRSFFDWDGDEGGYVINEDKSGISSPSPPDLVYQFLRKNRLLARTRHATILNWLRWSSGLTHDVSTKDLISQSFYRETTRAQEGFWHYRGFAPVLRVLEGTAQTLLPDQFPGSHHWTAGCWGTSGLFKNVLRTINIPVEIRQVDGHALPHFLSEKAFLSHGDDPYNLFFKSLPKPLPVEDLLVPDSEWENVKARKRIGYTPLRLAVKNLPAPLLVLYCNDQKKGLPDEKGEVFDALKTSFTMAELEKQDFWNRLKAARKARGCPAER